MMECCHSHKDTQLYFEFYTSVKTPLISHSSNMNIVTECFNAGICEALVITQGLPPYLVYPKAYDFGNR